MAVMGRKKQMVANLMRNREIKEREQASREREKMDKKEEDIDKEEHEKRMKMLKELGIIK